MEGAVDYEETLMEMEMETKDQGAWNLAVIIEVKYLINPIKAPDW